MRILIGGGIGGCDWKSWEVWKQCERRRPSYGFTRHQSIPSLGVPFAEDSLIHENYITCGQIQSRSEDFTCKHHLLTLVARSPKSCVRRRESNLQIRSDSPKAPSKDFSSRIHCLAATFSRPDTHSDPDATLCQTSGRGDVDGQIFNFCGDLVDKNIEQGCLLYFWLLLETNQRFAIWGPGTVQRAFALLSFNICFCQLCSNYVVLHYLFLPPSNSRNFWRPSSL